MSIRILHQSNGFRTLRNGVGAEWILTSSEYRQLKDALGLGHVESGTGDAEKVVPLRDTATAQLELELLSRAIRRTDEAITRAEETLRVLHRKYARQNAEWDRQSAAFAGR
jgi:hypothetical protein